jgi:transposase-like protein
MRKSRKDYTGEEKVALLKRHLVEGSAVSEICDTHNLQPTVFYRWQKEFFENGAAAFRREKRSANKAQETKVARLEAKIAQKDEVLAELMYEHVQLKKTLGVL